MRRLPAAGVAGVAAFAVLAIVAALALSRPGTGPAERSGEAPARPAQVGDELAEAFLRKVPRPRAIAESGTIVVTDETFSAAYDELYDRRDTYYGRDIELSGYVLREDGIGPGGFLLGRDLLWCCEDDLYFIGFVVFSSGPLPEAEATVRVKGRIEPRPYTDPESGKTFTVPAVIASRIDPEQGVARRVSSEMNR